MLAHNGHHRGNNHRKTVHRYSLNIKRKKRMRESSKIERLSTGFYRITTINMSD
ncbi:hypothetical protein Q7510_06130 [Glaesserella parasuis]|nr:hypothetical protein [Glaesserella parasuis]MDO9787355.1 hypothetical protein [Glaesserella parasuis]MDP0037395.1 hypothetical protein [Glaesserella parasuis]